MTIPAATPAFTERVDPNCAIDTVSPAAARAASVRPGPSWPNRSTQARGQQRGLQAHGTGGVVDGHHGEAVRGGEGGEPGDVRVVVHRDVAVGDHCDLPRWLLCPAL